VLFVKTALWSVEGVHQGCVHQKYVDAKIQIFSRNPSKIKPFSGKVKGNDGAKISSGRPCPP